MRIEPGFRWGKLSKRQRTVLAWWNSKKYKDYEGIICDGAIRSGKTVAMGFSFVTWAMVTFDRMNFGMCGKTIESFRRNVLGTLKTQLRSRGYTVTERKSENLVVISKGSRANLFYIFGGRDESSQDLIQGITLAGLFCDEVALMPESFVNQATARCSVEGSKYWFNCNPAGPMHWFYREWILKHKMRKILYLHFTMIDNLSLSAHIRQRYERQYVGVFYDRYIKGLWVLAEGLIYRAFKKDKHVFTEPPETEGDYYVSCDYGIQNANVFLLWRKQKGKSKWLCLDESIWSGRDEGTEKSVKELVDGLEEMLNGIMPKEVIIDPSASALKVELRKRGYKTRNANNDVVNGIEDVITMLLQDMLGFSKKCKGTIKEFGLYIWDAKAAERGEDEPVKKNDHCVVGNTLIHTTKGAIPIKDLQGTSGKLWCYSRFLKRKILMPYKDCRMTQKQADVFKITLEDGQSVKVTAEHRLLTDKGYKRAYQLTTEDRIICVCSERTKDG